MLAHASIMNVEAYLDSKASFQWFINLVKVGNGLQVCNIIGVLGNFPFYSLSKLVRGGREPKGLEVGLRF
jgi:hypothetical protein